MDSSEALEGYLSSHHHLLSALQAEFREVKQVTALAARRRAAHDGPADSAAATAPPAAKLAASEMALVARPASPEAPGTPSVVGPVAALISAASGGDRRTGAPSLADAYSPPPHVEAAAATLSAAFERLEGALEHTGVTSLFAQPGEILAAASATGVGGASMRALPPPAFSPHSSEHPLLLMGSAAATSPRSVATPQRLIRDAVVAPGAAGGTGAARRAPPPSPATLLRLSDVREWAAQHGKGGQAAARSAAITRGVGGGASTAGGRADSTAAGVAAAAATVATALAGQDAGGGSRPAALVPWAPPTPAAPQFAAGGGALNAAAERPLVPTPAAALPSPQPREQQQQQQQDESVAPAPQGVSHLFAQVRRQQQQQLRGQPEPPQPLLATSAAAAKLAGLSPPPRPAAPVAPSGGAAQVPASVIAAALRSRDSVSTADPPVGVGGSSVVVGSPLWQQPQPQELPGRAPFVAPPSGSSDGPGGGAPESDAGRQGPAAAARSPPLMRRLASLFNVGTTAASRRGSAGVPQLPLPPPPPPPPPPLSSRSKSEDDWGSVAAAASASATGAAAAGEVDTARGMLPAVSDAEVAGAADPPEVIFKGTMLKCGSQNRFWKARYCILTTRALLYYASRADAEREMRAGFERSLTRKGSVDLAATHVFVGRGTLKYTPTRHVCRLNTGGRTYVFALSSEDALMAWVGALVAVTQGDLRAEHVMPSTGDSTTARSFLGRVAAAGSGGLASIPEYSGAVAASTSAEGDDAGSSAFSQF